MIKIFSTLVLLITVAVNSNCLASAELLSAHEVMSKMKAAFEPEIASTRWVTFIIKKGESVTNTWAAREGRMKCADQKRYLLVITEPIQVKGFANLIWENTDGTGQGWVYLPALKQTKRLRELEKYKSLQITDFTYADIGFLDIRGSHKMLEEEITPGGKAYKLETVPEIAWCYSRVITWISQDNFLPLQRDLYDFAGKLWRRQFFENVTVINNIPTPLRIRMVDLQSKSSTEYNVGEVCYGASIPEAIFEPDALENALQYDFCPLPAVTPKATE